MKMRKIGELQVKFEEMNGWNADSDAAAMLSNLELRNCITIDERFGW